MKKLYLAGKISANDWRHDIVPGLRQDAYWEKKKNGNSQTYEPIQFGWYEYIGPYFVGCDHGCYHGNNSHGVGLKGSCGCPCEVSASEIYADCISNLLECDVCFAWIDSLSCYGSLIELGYLLSALQDSSKKQRGVVLAYPETFKANCLWFLEEGDKESSRNDYTCGDGN